MLSRGPPAAGLPPQTLAQLTSGRAAGHLASAGGALRPQHPPRSRATDASRQRAARRAGGTARPARSRRPPGRPAASASAGLFCFGDRPSPTSEPETSCAHFAPDPPILVPPSADRWSRRARPAAVDQRRPSAGGRKFPQVRSSRPARAEERATCDLPRRSASRNLNSARVTKPAP